MEIGRCQIPQAKGLVLRDFPFFQMTITSPGCFTCASDWLAINQRFLWPLFCVQLICQSGSQNLGKHLLIRWLVYYKGYKSVTARLTSLVAQTVKCLPTVWETWVQSLRWEDLLEKEMATHSSILAWKILWTEEPGRLQPMGSQRVRHDWATSLSLLL